MHRSLLLVSLGALMSAGWTGMTFIDDMERGVMENLLATPVWQGTLNLGLLAQSAAVTIVQSVVIVLLGLDIGARFQGDVAGRRL